MVPIPIETIREIATLHPGGYKEIIHNETSRLISFRNLEEDIRINVYYTTGTVATCLNHPQRGKTQLFRRNLTLETISELFRNPRAHTGAGYYHLSKTSTTKRTKTEIQLSRGGKLLTPACDDTLRWRYVQEVTDFCTHQQAAQIAAVCELWNQLRFAEGPTARDEYEAMPSELKDKINFCPDNCGKCGKDRVGSSCSLGQILIMVLMKTDPETTHEALLYTRHDDGEDGDTAVRAIAPPIGGPRTSMPFKDFFECPCREGQVFRNEQSHLLLKLQRQLMSFPKGIRRELLYFFFKKIAHGYDLFSSTKNDDGDLIDGVNRYTVFHKLNDAVLAAHFDYGELVYSPDDGNCKCHGCNVN